MRFNPDISLIILTYNEEKNIKECIESIKDLANEIFIVDSFSTDKTIEIAKKFTDKIYQRTFENYSKQRNWAFNNLPLTSEWIFNLDADHRVTKELAVEIKSLFSKGISADINGFLISRRTMFMGKWIRYGGHYPTYHSNFFRKGFGICEERLYDQHFLVEGKLVKLKDDIIDIISDSLTNFTARHNKWATLEAIEQLTVETTLRKNIVKADPFGNAMEKRRALRNYYNNLPLFIRPFIYFFIRYFLRLGFLDGKEGLIFHTLQGFWYRFLVDAKIYQIESLAKKNKKTITEIIKEHYGIEI